MFALRLMVVALSVFILAYCMLSVAVSTGWKFPARLWRSLAPARSADFLFGLRLFPLGAAIAITAVYVVPSYLVLEPAHVDEPLGPMLVVLAGGAFAWLLGATLRAVAAQKRTSRVLSKWVQGAKGADHGAPFPVLRLPHHDPVLTVGGICAPRVLVSETAATILTREELDVALRHEVAHIRHCDNLKKLLLRFAGFPAMAGLESAWLDMSEMAADDAAVSSASEALDLASALIKLSRFAPVQRLHVVTSALLPGSSASLTARLTRLFNWAVSQHRKSTSYMLPSVAAIAFLAVVTYGPMLAGAHALTEWLVR
jgi:Zn-dependent protease with chaperone function